MNGISQEQIQELIQTFPFEYVGGGYFRQKGVEKGQVAEIIHGDKIVSKVVEHIYEKNKN